MSNGPRRRPRQVPRGGDPAPGDPHEAAQATAIRLAMQRLRRDDPAQHRRVRAAYRVVVVLVAAVLLGFVIMVVVGLVQRLL